MSADVAQRLSSHAIGLRGNNSRVVCSCRAWASVPCDGVVRQTEQQDHDSTADSVRIAYHGRVVDLRGPCQKAVVELTSADLRECSCLAGVRAWILIKKK